MEEVKSVGFELFDGLMPYSMTSVFRRDIHPDSGSSVSRIEIEEVDAAYRDFSCWLLAIGFFYDEAELTVAVDIAGCGFDIGAQVLLGQGVMVRPIGPCRCIILPLIEERQIGRFYFA